MVPSVCQLKDQMYDHELIHPFQLSTVRYLQSAKNSVKRQIRKAALFTHCFNHQLFSHLSYSLYFLV